MLGKMKALRLYAPGDLRCVEVDIPELEKDTQVKIKVKSCGVCTSDIPRVLKRGTYNFPMTIGHEFAGEVVEVGAGVPCLNLGDRVTVYPMISCGACPCCQAGNSHLCESYVYYGSSRDGAMAEYVVVEYTSCFPLPRGVDYEMASMTESVSAGLHAIHQIGAVKAVSTAAVEAGSTAVAEAGSSAAVYGLGVSGFAAMQWLKTFSCTEVYVVDTDEEKLELAKRLGATEGFNPTKCNPVEEIRKRTDGGVDSAIEFSGNKKFIAWAVESVKKLGTVIYCGITFEDVKLPHTVMAHILRGEITIRGSWNSNITSMDEWKKSLELMSNGRIKVNPLITQRYSLEEGPKVFKMLGDESESFTKMIFKPEY